MSNGWIVGGVVELFCVTAACVIIANVRFYRALRAMTPEQREAYKLEERIDLQTW
ncbi:hypothetical protein SAMN05519103_00351 [Rhizobiales bacterium GAS113]|nr:hypothetical protein SAMN05519103_00351 [Rhizobiales bacterium GAS113]